MKKENKVKTYLAIISITILTLCNAVVGQKSSGYQHHEDDLIEIESTAELQWKNNTTMIITWPNQDYDLILLAPPKHLFEIGEEDCIFSGTLQNDHMSVATIDGCLSSAATIAHIASTKYGRWELILMANGTTLEHVEKSQLNKNETHLRMKRDTISIKDYKIAPQAAPNRNFVLIDEDDQNISFPTLVHWPLQVGYDRKFKELLDNIGENPKNFIKSIVNYARIYFVDPSGPVLPSKIDWVVDRDFQIIQDMSITADEACEDTNSKVGEMMVKRIGKSTPLMLFSGDSTFPVVTTGCAFLEVACGNNRGAAWGVVDYQSRRSGYTLYKHKVRMARTMVHEFGHMLGMNHDFHPNHGGEESLCNNKGVMSYGNENSANKGWTSCSISDFKKFWIKTAMTCNLHIEPALAECPSETNEDFCPVDDMVMVGIIGTTRKNCFFECSRVTNVLQSTNRDDTRGSGFQCMSTYHDYPKFKWCCNSRATSNIEQCPTIIERPDACPNRGCPITSLKGYLAPNAPLVLEYCEPSPSCDLVNDPDNGNDVQSGFSCHTSARPTKQKSYCCNDPSAKTTLPRCP